MEKSLVKMIQLIPVTVKPKAELVMSFFPIFVQAILFIQAI